MTGGSGDVLNRMLSGAATEAASSAARLAAAPPISAANSPVRSRPATVQQLPDRGRLNRSAATLRETMATAGLHRRLHSADARTPSGGHDAASAGDPAAAGDAVTARNAATADRVEQHNAAGFALRKRGDFGEAVREYSAALALAPLHFKAVFNRGFCYDKASLRPQRPTSSPAHRFAQECRIGPQWSALSSQQTKRKCSWS